LGGLWTQVRCSAQAGAALGKQYEAGQLTVAVGRRAVSPQQAEISRLRADLSRTKMSPISNQLFFMASYDVDRFRAFVMRPNFNETYKIPPEVMALLVADDEAPLDFSLNFLKHVLFGENFIEEYPDAYEKRLARKRERSERA
jgi:hypothetical protein